jgi:predicted methyltransferase
MKRISLLMAGAALLAVSAAPAPAATVTARMKEAVADPARPAADKARDQNRKPAEMLAFAGITPGKAVVDLLPGGGYFTRIFAKAVEPGGHVYAYFGTQYDARLKSQGKDPDNQFADLKQAYPDLSVIHAPLESFATPQPVDVVWTSLNYHDMHNKSYATDVAKVNKAIYAALKPGGYYVIVDHRAAEDAPDDVTEKLHRIKESTVKKEVEAAGFKLAEESNALANPADNHSERVFESDIRGHTDQMVLKFQKPR